MGRTAFGVLVLAAALGGCAGVEHGAVEVARAARGVSAADEAGAREDPQAAYYLELAEREMERARVQLRVGDAEGSRSWASRAGADAELARMLALEAATRGAAQRSEDDAEALSRALDRGR